MSALEVITIDGPNATGKGTLAQKLADVLGWRLLDTGLMYRAAGVAAADAGANLDDEAACGAAVDELTFELTPEGALLVNGKPASERLRSHEAGEAASRVGVHPAVRKDLMAYQAKIASEGEVILDGRDMGTEVCPEAKYKFYLTASSEERARRRIEQLAQRGESADYKQILADVKRRDQRDAEREASPLRPAEDAIIIDTSDHTPEQTFSEVRAALLEKGLPWPE
jgi:cytidylate kinase